MTQTKESNKYILTLRAADAPPIVVPSYSVEVYFALSEEQAERERVERCIRPELPDAHHAYSAAHDLPERLYEKKEYGVISTAWKIRKENAEEVAALLGLDRSDYPYHEALDMIEGEYFWIVAWDD